MPRIFAEPKAARRRRDKQRMKRRARKIYPDQDRADRLADHLAVCSCPLCGNERRHFGTAPIRERRILQEHVREILRSQY